MPTTRGAAALAITAVVVLAAGCSGDDNEGSAQSDPTGQTTGTPTGGTPPSPTLPPTGSETPPPRPGIATISPGEGSDSTAPVVTVTVSIADGEVDPKPGRVEAARGNTVLIAVVSDVADQIHVHGYDQEVAVQPGQAASLQFTADQTGLYEVETHESGLQLFQLEVR